MNRALLYIIVLLHPIWLSSCGYDSLPDFTPPKGEQWEPTCMISDLRSSPYTIKDDVIVEGVVVGNDSTGNFYKEVYIEQDVTDREVNKFYALRILLNYYDSYINFKLGSTYALNLKGLVVKRIGDTMILGAEADVNNATPAPIASPSYVSRFSNLQTSDLQINKPHIKISKIDPSYIGVCVVLDSLYFEEQLGSYAGDRVLVEYKTGNKVNLYTSEYAKFSDIGIKKGYLSIEAVVVQIDTQLKLMINSPEKVNKL